MSNFIACIMAGGSGTRFWPLSTTQKPKQFLRVLGEKSLFRATFDRLNSTFSAENVVVMSLPKYQEIIESQGQEIPAQNILLEPMLRNTAPAIAAVCAQLVLRNPDAICAFLPADHYIKPEEEFCHTLKLAAESSLEGGIVTIGLKPDHPSTAYGYIEGEIDDSKEIINKVFNVKSFHEKPQIEKAKYLISQGNCFFNAGIFVAKANFILQEIEKNSPEIFSLAQEFAREKDFSNREIIYAKMPKISFDYAVMENCDQIKVIPAGFTWSDVGTFSGLHHLHKTIIEDCDDNSNYIQSKVFAKERWENVGSSLVLNEREDFEVVLDQVDDLAVLISGNKVVITKLSKSDQIKKFSS